MTTEQPLLNWTVAIPESRELDLFAQMLTERGAGVVRCPLIAIYDSPNAVVVKAWMERFINSPPDDLIMLTGEGIRRLTAFAERHGTKELWITALQSVRKISRGPKPGRALREIGLKPDLLAAAPTTEGIITTLEQEDMSGRRVAVQLYGENPNERLQDFLREAQAEIDCVAPYIYAPDSEGDEVVKLIKQIIAEQIDILTLTSTPQLKRMHSVAKSAGLTEAFDVALKRTPIAAIGPIVLEQLEAAGLQASIYPDNQFFMKPLVRKMVQFVAEHPKA